MQSASFLLMTSFLPIYEVREYVRIQGTALSHHFTSTYHPAAWGVGRVPARCCCRLTPASSSTAIGYDP